MEIFEAFRESKVMLNQNLTYVVLAVWTWSLLQFCVVFRGTHRGRKSRISSLYPGGGVQRIVSLYASSYILLGSLCFAGTS